MRDADVADNLTTTTNGKVLDAKQGKVLNDKIGQVDDKVQSLDSKVLSINTSLTNLMPKRIFYKGDCTSTSVANFSRDTIYAIIVANGGSAGQTPCEISLLCNIWGYWTLTTIGGSNLVSLNANDGTLKIEATYGRNVVAIYQL